MPWAELEWRKDWGMGWQHGWASRTWLLTSRLTSRITTVGREKLGEAEAWDLLLLLWWVEEEFSPAGGQYRASGALVQQLLAQGASRTHSRTHVDGASSPEKTWVKTCSLGERVQLPSWDGVGEWLLRWDEEEQSKWQPKDGKYCLQNQNPSVRVCPAWSGSVHWLQVFFSVFSFCFVLFCFLGPHLWHMEVPRLGVKLELQQPATAMPDPSVVCKLYHSS